MQFPNRTLLTGNISLNLYDVAIDEAIMVISEAAGYVATYRHMGYLIHPQKPLEKQPKPVVKKIIRTFKLQYASPTSVRGILSKHITASGKVSVLSERKIVIIEDTPESILHLEGVLRDLDKKPNQILIEAKILEITLSDSEKFGLDWAKLFAFKPNDSSSTWGKFAISGLTNSTTGFLVNLTNNNISMALNALTETVILITPHIIKDVDDEFLLKEAEKMKKTEIMIEGKKVWSKKLLEK